MKKNAFSTLEAPQGLCEGAAAYGFGQRPYFCPC
jgi:hypothetical protein